MAAQRNLPIGVQSFDNIRNRGYLYVDKTQYIKDLLRGQVYFLSRPRRFGKSLLLSTLAAYFEGKKELFNGLFLEHGEPELAEEEGREAWVAYPVLRIDLNAKYYISEYDKPLMDTLHIPELHESYRGILHAFYSVIKSSDQYLRFVFLTGVTHFGKLTIFSGLNNLNDISMDTQYAGICGVTETELVSNFAPELELLASKLGFSYEDTLSELKKHYDGYLFSEDGEHVYNPFSLLNVLQKSKLDDYWYATGTPTFLVKYLQEQAFPLPSLEKDVEMGKEGLQISPLEARSPIPILFQAGYLTIKEKLEDYGTYLLGFPNEEVRYGFMKNLLLGYSSVVADSSAEISKFLRAIRSGDVDAFMTHLKAIIGGIPYSNQKKENYHEYNGEVAVYLVFSLMGQRTETEVHCPGGRADAVVHTPNAIYIFEFKLEGSGTPEDALAQIEERGYAARYLGTEKKIVCIGVTFDPKTRNIAEWKAVSLNQN